MRAFRAAQPFRGWEDWRRRKNYHKQVQTPKKITEEKETIHQSSVRIGK